MKAVAFIICFIIPQYMVLKLHMPWRGEELKKALSDEKLPMQFTVVYGVGGGG